MHIPFLHPASMPYRRFLVVGDIHGMSVRFMDLMERVRFDPKEDFLVLLGDYIDRGDGALIVLEQVRRYVEGGSCVALRGKHEQMLLDYFRNGDTAWLNNGGSGTLSRMLERPKEKQDAILSFCASLPLSYRAVLPSPRIFRYLGRTQGYFFTHGGVDPTRSLNAQEPKVLLASRPELFDGIYKGPDTLVVGHTPTMFLGDIRFLPLWRGHVLYMDTASYFPEGRISCVDLLTGDIFHSQG